MKKINLRIFRDIRYPFYHASSEAGEEEFLNEEFKIVWDEAKDFGIILSMEERLEIFLIMDCVAHIHQDGIDYFYCQDIDEYWEQLAAILDKRE